MKDPAVLFYTSDFLTGTILMNFEQKGRYIHLLCIQHQQGPIPEGEFNDLVGGHNIIRKKFKKDDDNNYYNERLFTESIKRSKFVESRRKNAKGRGEHMLQHMENENENENRKRKLFKNSGVTLELIQKSFLSTKDLVQANAEYYYQAVSDWSAGDNKMKVDWIAVVRNWARRDLQEGKLKIKKKDRVQIERVDENYGVVTGKESPMPDSLKKKFNL